MPAAAYPAVLNVILSFAAANTRTGPTDRLKRQLDAVKLGGQSDRKKGRTDGTNETKSDIREMGREEQQAGRRGTKWLMQTDGCRLG